MLVSPRGEVETFASDALQPRMDDWFTKSGIAAEARQRTLDKALAQSEDIHAAVSEEAYEDTDELQSGAMMPATTTMGDDPFLDSWSAIASSSSKSMQGDELTQLFKRSSSTEPHNILKPGPAGAQVKPIPMPLQSTPQRIVGMPRGSASSPSQFILTLQDEDARTTFMELRFDQLQQNMCKMIAKEWIKVIEPKKQTRCPYNKGETGKPAWWPEHVRHKEPDHLMKSERLSLLLSLLRSRTATVARLQLATAEVVVQIKSGKVSLLMDIYRVAREEEKLRDQSLDINTPITVGVSSLEGWNATANCPAEPQEEESLGSPLSLYGNKPGESIFKLMSTRKRRRQSMRAVSGPPVTASAATPVLGFETHGSPMRGMPYSPAPHAMQTSMSFSPMVPMDAPRGPSAPENTNLGISPMHPTPLHRPNMLTSNPAGSMPLFLPPQTPGASYSQPPSVGRHDMLGYSHQPEMPHSVPHGAMMHGAQLMKPARPAPAQMPNSPTQWEGRSMYVPPDTYPMEHAMGSGQVHTNENRNVLAYHHAMPMHNWPYGMQYQQPWFTPESPMHRPPLMNVGVASDVRFSPSFDASFSSSAGPLTPGNISMNVAPEQAQIPPSGAMMFHPPAKPANVNTEIPSFGQGSSTAQPPFNAKSVHGEVRANPAQNWARP
ncbi:hypothetical protein MVES1_001056 [Malassezia vespertilionis]|uniref:Subtelomeric hrmA-associated cluster protein AFUB-079030/YDR124W-like helical bundle domain-containing protein n=1 Tax=Malassezia vespertilionis TaxID=2020962 RepID=A0A2N1JET6_9BASI|nr:uncharacterized protein MVES1_001056 [Malassezia vespertilionis]PKI85061.1 hypothetical protein MVES_000996 [Malassezia vespertilionis]WFD05723.1 hypothetical protein MVES1_001056 [Malassezia vespertilionis]